MISIKINGIEFLSKPFISILEACKNIGITIPRFCYHEILSVSGNCRMCLVEIEDMEKPVASCVTEVVENMSIYVDSPFVKKARESVIESLLLHHPLDCPICDQAGECDLQDQAKAYGGVYSRYFFEKKGTEDKYCGPLIKTIMTRCIKCTRCVRYAEEITGLSYFGTLNRGVDTEIGSYVTKLYKSEISGNVIDLCPVGALTSKPYAFKARPWELRLVESIDTNDSLGSSIYANYKESDILRIIPKNNIETNASLITDKARFNFDSNNINRVFSLFVRSSNNIYVKNSWQVFFKTLQKDFSFTNKKISFFLNQEVDLETLVTLKKLKNVSSSKISLVDTDLINKKSNLYLNKQFNLLDVFSNYSDIVVFVGTNLRFENALLNARVRHKYRKSFLSAFSIGGVFESNFPLKFVNLNLKNSLKLFEGKCSVLSSLFHFSKSGLVFIGDSFTNRVLNSDFLISQVQKSFKNLKFVKVHLSSNTDALNWLNISKDSLCHSNVNFYLSTKKNGFKNKFKDLSVIKEICIDSHFPIFNKKFDFILPSKTIFEHAYSFLNLEHKLQKTTAIVNTISEARPTHAILSSIFNINLYKFRFLQWCSHLAEQEKNINNCMINSRFDFINHFLAFNAFAKESSRVLKYPLKLVIKDFYASSKMSSYSKTMKICSSESKVFSNTYSY
jgi:NADH-quinone oxidoreductase chain G